MNLYDKVEEQALDRKRAAVFLVILAVCFAALVKFGIYDQFAKVQEKQSELSVAQGQLSAAEQSVSSYDSVLSEYNSYVSVSSSSGVDADSVLTMVESIVMPQATVSQLSLKDTTLTLTLSNVSLDTVGTITQQLSKQSGVTGVSVSTAQTSTDGSTSSVVATVVVTLSGSNTSSSSNTTSNSSSTK
jgi:hypothetical protein